MKIAEAMLSGTKLQLE